jgi:hypothetical protein
VEAISVGRRQDHLQRFASLYSNCGAIGVLASLLV